MTILVSHVSTMTRWGGVEQMLVDLLTQSKPSQFRHSLMATSIIEDIVAPIYQAGVMAFKPSRRFRYNPTAIRQMAQWLRTQKVQVVHGYNAPAGAWAGMAATLARVPVFIGGEHGTVWSVQPPMLWLSRWAYRQAQMVIVNSKASRLMVCKRFGISPEKIQIVYNTIPTFLSPLENDRNPFRETNELIVGSVGRLSSPKHYQIFIEAAAIVLRQNQMVRFVLIGGGEQEASLTAQIRELGIQERFILTGWQENARSLIRHFDVFVSTSLHESFGNVLIEAAMAGKPVIAPCVDGIPEAVIDGCTGILLNPTITVNKSNFIGRKLPQYVVIDGQLSPPKALDPHRVAEAILLLIDDHSLRQRLGQAGQQRVNQLFTLSRYQKDLESVYTTCLDKG